MICKTYGLLIRNRKTLKQHIKEIHSERVNIYKCDFFGRPLSRKFNLKKPLKTAHGTEENSMSSSKQLSRDKLKENQKAVNVPLYEDISSDEKMQESEHVRWCTRPKLKTFHPTKKCLTIQMTMWKIEFTQPGFRSDGLHVIIKWWWIARGLRWGHSKWSRVWRRNDTRRQCAKWT